MRDPRDTGRALPLRRAVGRGALRVALLSALLVVGASAVWARPLPPALAAASSIDAARAVVARGEAGWPEYLRWLRGRTRSVFERADLRANAAQGKYTILERGPGTAILRDLKALESVERQGRIEEEHLLGIPTWGRAQPTWVSSVARRDAAALGRMIRSTLEEPRERHGTGAPTYGYFHLPGGISQPITHFHARFRPEKASTVASWDTFLAANYRASPAPAGQGYRIYRVKPGAEARAAAWPILAVADPARGSPAALDARTDELVGRMFRAVARAAIRRAPFSVMTTGELQIDGADNRIVVRLAAEAMR